MKRRPLGFAGLALLFLAACGDDDPVAPPAGPPTTLEQAMRLWQSHGLQNYSVDERRSCFCPPPREWTAVVRNGVVEGQGWTVEELFEQIGRAEQDADVLEVTYDAVYGYPTSVFVDWQLSMADEEMHSEMSNLVRLVR